MAKKTHDVQIPDHQAKSDQVQREQEAAERWAEFLASSEKRVRQLQPKPDQPKRNG